MSFFDIFRISAIKAENKNLKDELDEIKTENQNLKNKLDEIGANDIFQARRILEETKIKNQNILENISEQKEILKRLNLEIYKLNGQEFTSKNRISKNKELYNAMMYSLDNYFNKEFSEQHLKLPYSQIEKLDELCPSVILKLHCMDMRDLRKEYRKNDKLIDKVLEQYASRYTTKANKAIYKLMVIALRAELQNILYNLKYEKLDTAIENTKKVTKKYLNIAGEGNQSILPTLTKFIGEIEYLFINAVKIEYNYYVKKEQAKQEQKALREQMRQEAEERKALEAEKKKIEKEESKYNTEIEKLKSQLADAQESEIQQLNAKIIELQNQLSQVIIKKNEVINLQNGKAGNVYIISNLGSFGENVFKVGMTRRLEPQERIDELSNASVPFRFDVHSFIFSDDAVSLEKRLHEILNDKRVNKVNLRKEFFNVSLDEIENIVNEVEPTAEFNRTMLAEEYRQSLSSSSNYVVDKTLDYDDEFDDD